ncbi:MAG: HAD family hydrolase [Nitriliruptoraceae bacterium]
MTVAGRRLTARAVLFDKDGTLIDLHAPWSSWAFALVDALRERQPELPASPLHAALGVRDGRVEPDGALAGGTDAMITAALTPVLSGAGITDPAAEIARGVARAHRAVDVDALVQPLPGVQAIVRECAALADGVAVVTADTEERAWRHLAHIGVAEAVDVVVGADRVAHGKPDPEPVVLACEELGVPPAAVVSFGDSTHDALAAERAGIAHRVLVRPTEPDPSLQAVAWARSWSQVTLRAGPGHRATSATR